MENKLVAGIVATAIAVIVLAGVLMPALDDATTTHETFKNEGYFYLNKLASTDTTDHTVVWDATSSNILTVDDVNIDVSTWRLESYQSVTIFATDTDMLRLGVGSGGLSVTWIQIRGSTISYAQASSSLNATIGGGNTTMYIDSGVTPRTLTYTDAYLITSEKADYVMKKSNETVYMLKDSPVFSIGYTSLNNNDGGDNVVLLITGTMEDFDISVIRQSSAYDITFSNKLITATASSDYVNLYSFDKYTFTATENSTDTNCTYSYVIVPTEITAEKAQHLEPAMNTILSVIPFLIIVAVLLGVVAIFIARRE